MRANGIKSLSIVITIIAANLISCQGKANDDHVNYPGHETLLVEQTIRNNIGWAVNKDFELLRSTILLDSTYLVVNPTDRVDIGVIDFMATEEFFRSPDFQAVGFEISDLRINIAGGGEVAWFFCMLDDRNTWKGNPADWENVRWTGVLEKSDGNWKIRQMHFSWPE